MQDHFTDEGVFIRSLASRGSLGGLSRSVNNVVRLLDAFGRDVIIVETVGAGQVEVEIIKVAQTIIVVMSPGYGDVIQMLKAGIIEIGDIFVINKSDLEGANRTFEGLLSVLELNQKKEGWNPPILQTVAVANKGITELVDTIQLHRDYIEKTSILSSRESKRIENELIQLVNEQVYEKITKGDIGEGENLNTMVSKVLSKRLDPYSAAQRILSALSKAEHQP
jgi:LAO/AO transport system kinase